MDQNQTEQLFQKLGALLAALQGNLSSISSNIEPALTPDPNVDQQEQVSAIMQEVGAARQGVQAARREVGQVEGRVRTLLETHRKASDELKKEMRQQQEDFFSQLQSRDTKLSEAQQTIAKLEVELKHLTELESQKSEQSAKSAVDDGSIPALSMKNEEETAKARKTILQKYQLESYRLKSLLSSSPPSPTLQQDGPLLIATLDTLVAKLTADDKERQRVRIKLDSKIKSLQDSNSYLEKRITQMIGEKEEEIIKLKSEVIVYKQKGKSYKEQMLTQRKDYETNAEKLLQERVQAAKNQYIDEMKQIKDDNSRLKSELNRMIQENKDLQGKCQELEREFNTLNTDKNEEIEKLKEALQGIESKHDRKLKKINVKKIETENKLNVEEKERELFGLKLEQVLINNKKLQLQKKFLEKQLEKDLREIHIEMNKIEIDIQQDQLLGPNSALHRFRSVYQQVSDQLHYIQQIVGFMEFDQEGLPGGQKAHIDPGVQPQTFEDVARDIQEKIQAKQQQEQQLYVSHHDVQLSEHGPDMIAANTLGSPQRPNEGSTSQDMGSAPRQSRIQDIDTSFKKNVGYTNQNDQSLNMSQQQPTSLMQERSPMPMSTMQNRRTSYGQGSHLLNDPMELICALLNTLLEVYREVEIFPSEAVLNAQNIVNSKAQPAVVKDITEKYLDQNKIQLQQFMLRQQDRCKELEIECKNLQFRVQRAKLDMKRVDYSGPNVVQSDPREEDIDQYSVEQIDDDGVPTTEPSRAGVGQQAQPDQRIGPMDSGRDEARIAYADEQIDNVSIDEDKSEDGIDEIDQKMRSASKLKKKPHKSSGPAVPVGAGNRAQYEAMVEEIDSLKQQNQALKERCKEIRLNLQRKITELQDTLIITKQKFLSEISSLKVEYGLDLSRVTRTNEEKQEDLVKQMEKVKEDEIQQLQHEFEMEKRSLEEKIQMNQDEAQREINKVIQEKKDAIAELRKLKSESTGYSQGGWGTFVLAFEDQEATQKFTERQEKKNVYKSQERTPRSGKQKHGGSASPNPIFESSKKLGSSSHVSEAFRTFQESEDHPHPIEKINHFIEVGFLIDQNNFRLLDRHQELTYDAIIKKYLFELQDPLSNYEMNELEFKIKQQLNDNIGLFNDINPLYISLNMGRPAEPFFDDYINSEHYRLIEREGIYLMGNRWMMINFLRCDNANNQGLIQPDVTPINRTNASKVSSDDGNNNQNNSSSKNAGPSLRVIAFENATMSQFSFDLNYYDLLTLMHGNMKLLEDENSHDLCQIILNNLTMIKREKFGQYDKQGNPIYQDYLIVEHRIFFNEQYRSIYDKKNKNIMAKYDKKRQGLVQDKALITDFEKSVIYEAFESVYSDSVNLQSAHNAQAIEPVHIQILSGTMSGNTLLRVTFPNLEYEVREMCLFADGQARSHKMCSEIVYVPAKIIANRSHAMTQRTLEDGAEVAEMPQPLAYVISIEKLFGHDQILVVRLVLIEKWDQNVMLDYSWQPESKPQEGTTQFRAETIYLVKKSDFQYCRVTEYEILNTEIRTLLFMHSYGYIQSYADFGNIRRYLEQGELRRCSYLSGLGTEEYFREALNINIQEPADLSEYQGLNQLLYRKFSLIRVRKFTFDSTSRQNNTPNRSHGGSEIEDGQSQSNASQGRGAANLKSEPDMINQVGEPSNYDALVAIFIDGQCLERSEVIIKVVIQELSVDIMQNVLIQNEMMGSQALDQLIYPERKEELCCKIIDQLVLEEYVAVGQALLTTRQPRRLELMIDLELKPISETVSEAKQKTFEEMLRHQEDRETDDNIKMEIKDVTQMMIPLTTLANCAKTSINSIINQKPYKIHAYFVVNYPGFEPSVPEISRMFDWHFVYLEVVHRVADQQLVFAVTEKDIVTIMQMHRQKMRVEGKELKKNLTYKNMPKEEVLDFIMDCLVMDATTNEIRLSMIHLSQRVYERSILEERFVINGGRFIQIKDGVDPEMQEFKTQVPNTELSMKMLTNNQKEMSDKGFDVKLYELQLKSFPGTKKIRFEIFWLDDPEMVFRCDMFSNENQDCSQIVVEKINIVEHIEYLKLQDKIITQDKYNPSKFAKDGLVLAICESNFPHNITFMLIEPCSHIQWEYSYQDDKLNVIEPRKQKMNFVANLRDAFQNSIVRGINDSSRAMKIRPGDQELVGEDQQKDTFYIVGDLQKIFFSSRKSDSKSLIYSYSLQVTEGEYRNLRIFSDHKNDTLILRLEHLENPKDHNESKEISGQNSASKPGMYPALAFQRRSSKQNTDIIVKLNSQMEGSRIVSGAISYDFGLEEARMIDKNLIYTVEVSCALEREQKAYRVSLFDQSKQRTLVNVVFLDEFVQGRSGISPEVSFALRSGFIDSMAILQKISCLSSDYHKLQQLEEIRSKTEDTRSADIYGDMNGEGTATGAHDLQKDRKVPRKPDQPPSREEESTFVSISKLKERLMNKAHKQNTLVYRKVMKVKGGGTTSKNVLISALKESNPMYAPADKAQTRSVMQSSTRPPIHHDEFLIKLIISETKRVEAQSQDTPLYNIMRTSPQSNQGNFDGYRGGDPNQQSRPPFPQPQSQTLQKVEEYIFVYRYDEIFTKAEIKANEASIQELRTLRRMIASAISKRLRVREIPDVLSINSMQNRISSNGHFGTPQNAPYRYVAFFIDEDLAHSMPKNPVTENVDILEGRTQFDMRHLHSFALLDPHIKVLPLKDKNVKEKQRQKQTLLYQFEKDDLLFDVFEVLNPEELRIRIKVYQQGTFRMLTCCDIGETDLKAQLVKDRRSFLTGSTQREELAKYIIENSYFDEHANSLRFMISDLVEEI